MWKITFRYSDGGVITVRGKGKDIPLHLAQKYYRDYGVHSRRRDVSEIALQGQRARTHDKGDKEASER